MHQPNGSFCAERCICCASTQVATAADMGRLVRVVLRGSLIVVKDFLAAVVRGLAVLRARDHGFSTCTLMAVTDDTHPKAHAKQEKVMRKMFD